LETGIIVKALAGFYYVEDKLTKAVIQCRSRGLFRKQNISPLVGDYVSYTVEKGNDGYVMEVGERKNQLVRPPIANIDLALVVFSASEPSFSVKLLDRFLAVIEDKRIEPVIVITKMDLISEEELKELTPIWDYYENIGYRIFKTSSKDHQGLRELDGFIKDQTIVICGQSGVGKSSLLNELNTNLDLAVNEISRALGRGKHTTRHVQLHSLGDARVADTPGFSSLDLDEMEVEELSFAFLEFDKAAPGCRFRGCLHENEPGCAIKEKTEAGDFLESRYENYLVFLNEIKARKPKY